jgi:hypothetical protein
MPPRVPMPAPALPHHALRGLACLLALGWMGQPLPAGVDRQPRPGDPTAPYLPVTGPVALRFQAPPLPPTFAPRPAAGGPPVPTAATEGPPLPEEGTAASHRPDVTKPGPSAAESPVSTAAAPKPTPPPILPDDTRPRVQPEDFLPYFQFPAGPSGDAQIITPFRTAPAPADRTPPSSATYRQQ